METTIFSGKVLTVEEISQYLRVPEETVLQEIHLGRLRALHPGGHVRIPESELEAYLNASLNSSGPKAASSPIDGTESTKLDQFGLVPASPFSHTWPDKTTEKFTEVYEGTVSDGGRERRVKIGFTLRDSAGKRRRRSLVLVDRYPTVEFVAADEKTKGAMASIIKDRNGKQLPVGATLPSEYHNLPVGAYHDVVKGPRASNGLAVVCDSQDFTTMVRHALIRYRFRETRAK
jgi:excisionase family DNA binding protein